MKKIIRTMMLLAAGVAATSCAGEKIPAEEPGTLLISLASRGADDMVKGGDGGFSSLAVYLFNKDNNMLEFVDLQTGLTDADTYTKTVNVTQSDKWVYAIANYAGQAFTSGGAPLVLSAATTRAQLDDMQLAATAFSDDNLVMVGKGSVVMSGTSVAAAVEMERLAGRIDCYMYKAATMNAYAVELVSVQFCNQVTATNGQYQSAVMPAGPIRTTQTHTAVDGTLLTAPPAAQDYAALTPADAETSFYTFQNISGATVPDDAVTPYLLVTVKVNGTPVTYRGDLKNMAGTYDLERNKVYRIKSVIDTPNDRIFLAVEVLDWDTEPSEIEFDDDAVFTFTGLNQAGNTGQVGVASAAEYSLLLSGPAGALWSATLTNGLDFAFNAAGGAVSQGIARENDAYTISVAPTKAYAGTARETKLYITVEGERLAINPAGAGGSYADGRQYPGTDTEILIRQTL